MTIAVSDGAAYAGMYMFSGNALTGTGSIESTPTDGGPVTAVASNESPPPGLIMVLGDTIYWLNQGMVDGLSTVAPDTVRVLRPGGTPATLPIDVASLRGPLILAPSGGYWYASTGTTYGRFAL